MALTDLGIAWSGSESTTKYSGIISRAGSAERPAYIKWRSVNGVSVNKSFDITVDYRCVPRGSSDEGWWTDWSGGVSANVSSSACSPRQSSEKSGWQWSIDLATLLDLCGIKEGVIDGSTFGFNSRKHDVVQVKVGVKSNLNSGKTSARIDKTLTLSYFPEYGIERVWCDSPDEVKVEYSSPNWERTDDLWVIQAMEANGESMLSESAPNGTVARLSADENGVVVVPVSELAKAAPAGKSVYVDILFNTPWRTSTTEFASAEATLTCTADFECSTPTLAATVSDGVLRIAVGDSGDKADAVDTVTVKMDGSEYSFDQQTVKVGGEAVFAYAPRGRELSFSAVAVGVSGVISEAAVASVQAIPSAGAATLVSLSDPMLSATAKYDVRMDDDHRREKQTIKLAGRKRPSAFYGEGGETSWSLSFSVLPEKRESDASCRRGAWSDVADAGDAVMLLCDGARSIVSVDSLSFSRACDSGGVTSAFASLTEVGE